jgi:hypothetical protein
MRLFQGCIGFLVFALMGCQQKKIDLKISEIECKTLKLSNATYNVPGGTCLLTNRPLAQSAVISVNHNGKKDCLDFLKLSAKFLKSDGSVINDVTYKNSYRGSDPEVKLMDNSLSITVTWQMPDQASANELRTVEFELFSENDLQNQSNKLYFTIGFGCVESLSNGTEYELVRDLSVSSAKTSFYFYDYSAIDDDSIDVYLNDVRVITNLKLTASKALYNFTINSGTNKLVVIAKNEGSSPPNTCGLIVNSQDPIKLTPGLTRGQGVSIRF